MHKIGKFALTPLLSVIFLSLALAGSAHADTVDFTYTPTGGTAVTFSLDSTAPSVFVAGQASEFDVTFSDGSDVTLDFVNPDYFASLGYGPANLELINNTTGTDDIFYGVQLYSGSESSPTFTPGQYTLGAATLFGLTDSGTLGISLASSPVSGPGGGPSNVAVAPTPEPSSIALLGTGALACASLVRRRRKA